MAPSRASGVPPCQTKVGQHKPGPMRLTSLVTTMRLETPEQQKQAAAEAAAEFVFDGMTVGLGTGSTVAYLLPALASRRLNIRCVATSPATEEQARSLGLVVLDFDEVDRFDIAIDGADQVAPDGWLVKGGGAAHTREKVVAASAERFIVIADASKVVSRISAPIPLELLSYGLAATLRRLDTVQLRAVPNSPDGGVIADYLGTVNDPGITAAMLSATPGVVDHGLFSPLLVSDLIIATPDGVSHRKLVK